MKEDPISKSQLGVGMGEKDVIKRSQGRGTIYTDRDYSSALTSRRSRAIFVALCLIPYIGICLVVYSTGVEILAIAMLAIPLVMLLLFWFIHKITK